MQTPKRPCLTCRILITPTKENPSHCNIHKPTIKKYKYKDKRRRAYEDPEYRRNKSLIKKAQRNCVLCNTEGNASNPLQVCLLYTSPSPRDGLLSRMPSSA